MNIIIAVDTPEATDFIEYLEYEGHIATIGQDTRNYIDGIDTSTDETLNETMNNLWLGYCYS